MRVSICVITYNQETTIRQTLDTILSQVGDFDLEVVVGDDHSSDTTRTICEEYVGENRVETGGERKLRLLPDEPNMGIMANVARVMSAASGDYIGLIAGDDYWCDDHKLEKQLRYMQIHPDCGVCFTDGYKLLVKQKKLVSGLINHSLSPNGDESSYFFDKSYRGGPYMLPLSMLVSREMMRYINFDEFLKRKFPVEDYPMQAIWSKHTKFGVLRDKTVVYRVYKESATFIGPEHPKYLWYHKGLMNIRRYLNELFPKDVVFDEDYCRDYEFWKEFLLYVYQFDYSSAKKLAIGNIYMTRNALQAHKMTKNRFIFICFCIYKRIINYKTKSAL